MRHRRVVNALFSCTLILFSFQTSARAAIVPTPLSASPDLAAPPGDALALRLEQLGVASDVARLRVARLTPAERAQLWTALDAAPAGGDALGALTFVALLLLLTDLLGITDIYPFVTETVNDSKPGSARVVDCPPAATAAAQP